MNAPELIPQTALVYGLPNEEYHAQPELSNTGLRHFERSPFHYYSLHLDPLRPTEETTTPQLEGTLAHCAILEPDEFLKRYIVTPADAPRKPTAAQWAAKNPSPDSVAAMAWWREFNERTGGKVTISAEQYTTAMRQGNSVRRNPQVRELLARGHAEVSAFWTDPASGVRCRCRPDFVHDAGPGRAVLVDVKTFGNASPQEFRRQIARMGYHGQAAFYSDGYAHAAGVEVLAFVFVAIEADWPHAASAVMLDEPSMAHARETNAALLQRFAQCQQSQTWPSYSEAIELVSLPAWAFNRSTDPQE